MSGGPDPDRDPLPGCAFGAILVGLGLIAIALLEWLRAIGWIPS